jgi:cytochrome c556
MRIDPVACPAMLAVRSPIRREKVMLRKLITISAAVAVTQGVSVYAVADTTAEDAADYRAAIMTSIRGHLVASSMIVRGLVEDRGQLVNHARGIANNTTELDHIFPKGSNVVDSEALPVIWEEPEEFAAAIAKTQDAAAAFVEAAENGDSAATSDAFRNLGKSCRGCHDQFRVSDD